MFDRIILVKSPLKPNYEKVIAGTDTIQANFLANYIDTLKTYSYKEISLPTSRNVRILDDKAEIILNESIEDIREYNYVGLYLDYDVDDTDLRYYFIVGYRTYNENNTILSCVRDAWVSNYAQIVTQHSFKQKIVRSHAPIATNTEYNLNFNHILNYSKTQMTPQALPPIIQYTAEERGRVTDAQRLLLPTTLQWKHNLRVLFAKITCTEPLYDDFYGVGLNAPTCTYYIPIKVYNLTTNSFEGLYKINVVKSLRVTVEVNETTTYNFLTDGNDLTVNGYMAEDISRISHMIKDRFSTKNIISVSLTYNYPQYYTFDSNKDVVNFSGSVRYENQVPILGIVCSGTDTSGSYTWVDDLYKAILQIADTNMINFDYTNFAPNFAKFKYTVSGMNNDYYNKYPFKFTTVRLNNKFYDINTIGGKSKTLTIEETKGLCTTFYKVLLDDVPLAFTRYINNDTGNLAVTRNVMDYYIATQGGSSIASVLTSGAGKPPALAALSLGVSGVNALSKLADMYSTPDALSQAGNNAERDLYLQDILLVLQYEAIEDEYIKTYKKDVYYKGIEFTYYESIFKKTRTYFDYKRTENCSLPFIRNNNDRAALERAFDNGVTIIYLIGNTSVTNLHNFSLNGLTNGVV